jgi:hypothetical protein
VSNEELPRQNLFTTLAFHLHVIIIKRSLVFEILIKVFIRVDNDKISATNDDLATRCRRCAQMISLVVECKCVQRFCEYLKTSDFKISQATLFSLFNPDNAECLRLDSD